VILVVATLAGLAFTLAGYLAGARLGRTARDALRSERDAARGSVAEVERRLEAEARTVDELRGERDAARARGDDAAARLAATERSLEGMRAQAARTEEIATRLAAAERALEGARAGAVRASERSRVQEQELARARAAEAELRASMSKVASTQEQMMQKMRADLGALSRTLEARGSGESALSQELARHLAPIADRERLGRALSSIAAETRHDLPTLLDAIASAGGFGAVLLSDDLGLPLATSRNAPDAEVVAGASSLLFTYSDRLAQTGMAAPLATLIHDEADRLTLHRTLKVQGQRYALTALGRSGTLSHASLDPAIDVVERVLSRGAWQAA
jgi:hypothetical protein